MTNEHCQAVTTIFALDFKVGHWVRLVGAHCLIFTLRIGGGLSRVQNCKWSTATAYPLLRHARLKSVKLDAIFGRVLPDSTPRYVVRSVC